MSTLPLAVTFAVTLVLAAAPAVDPAVERLFQAIACQDLAAVEALLEADPRLAAATEPASRQRPQGGNSAVLTAALVSNARGFQPPASNAVVQALLARTPALDVFDACVAGRSPVLAEHLARDPKLARAWHAMGWTALHLGGFSGDTKVVEMLLANGADVHARARTRFRNTPLQTSLLAGQAATARLLLEHGADPLVRQAHGSTPLQDAALLGRRDLVDLLLAHGAELSSRADDGRTALTEALRGGHPELAEYLKSKGGRGAEITADLAAPPKD